MANYNDTIASRLGFTAAQAASFMGANWPTFERYLERVDESRHKATYAAIAQRITQAGGVENCGGFDALANEFAISEKLVRRIFDDLLLIAEIYKTTIGG